jgi:hypothetical protein
MADALADRERELYHAKEKAEEAAARITTIFEYDRLRPHRRSRLAHQLSQRRRSFLKNATSSV